MTKFLFFGSKITADGDCSHEIRRQLLLDSVLKSRDTNLPTKVSIVKAVVFPVVTLWLWELDHKEGRMLKNWCLQTLVLEKTPESPLDSREIKPVNLKGNRPKILLGRTDAEVETLVFWSSDVNSWLNGKVPDVGKDWGQKESRASEDEMAGWHHQCNGHELGQTLGDDEGQRGLACCSPWVCRAGHDRRLNNNSRYCVCHDLSWEMVLAYVISSPWVFFSSVHLANS